MLVVLYGTHAGDGWAQQIVPFRLTGVDGHVSMRFLKDENVTQTPATGTAGAARSRQALADLRTEVFVMTHSYVYHPNFLLLDVGAGPILQRGSFANESGETRSSGTLYNLTGRATFLRDKPYRGSLFYEHLNPTLSVAPGQVINQEARRYGFDVSLLDPITPVPVTLDATRSRFKGRGADRIIDDQVDRLNLRASRSFGALGLTQVHYQAAKQDSQSGSPNLPIQASSSSSQGLSADTRLQFGAARQYSLANLISFDSQRYQLGAGAIPERKDARVLLDLRAIHSADLHSFGSYNYSASDQGVLTSMLQAAAAGLSYALSPQLSTTLGARTESNRTSRFDARAWGADGSVRYQRELPAGTGQASYGLRYERREQQSTAPQTSVIGERLMLSGTAFVTLAQQRVIAGSVTVSNVNRTQTFLEGMDYRLTVIGLDSRIQRAVGGNIADGQEVLVDYAYDVGGTYAFGQLDHNLGLSWAPTRYLNVHYRYFEASPHLISGAPTFQLNTIRSSTYGARADLPLRLAWETWLGGSYEHEDRRETISPYRREAYDFYAQTEDPFFGIGNLRLTGRQSRVQYENSVQDVNLRGYDLRYFSRHPLGIDLTADAGYERDTGGVVPRSRTFGSLRAQWRYRKATLQAEFLHVRESQGGFERTRTAAQLLFRRDL